MSKIQWFAGRVFAGRAFGAIVPAALAHVMIAAAALAQSPQPPPQPPTSQQLRPIIRPGDAAVTAFSGAREAQGILPVGLNPLDVTFIDLDGIVAQVRDLSNLGGPPRGQLVETPIRFTARARDIGQVFGVTLDADPTGAARTPNIYLTAGSTYGLQLVKPNPDGGLPVRLSAGEPGARWMPGQWGEALGGGPGSVWKIDGVTGAISLFANLTTQGQPNSGAALGNIAYDSASKQLFVTNLESGMIHRLGLDGSDRGTFDHGVRGRPKGGLPAVPYTAAYRANIESPDFNVEQPASWGFADQRRMVWGIRVWNGRVYYATAEGPEIWSVGLAANGAFADDARRELKVEGTPSGNPVTHILFDASDIMYVAQRGEIAGSYDYRLFAKPQASVVYRYKRVGGRWTPAPEEYAIGLPEPHRLTVGGVALNYGYDPQGRIDYGQCNRTLWTTGEHLRQRTAASNTMGGPRGVNGLQGADKELVRPQNLPPTSTWFIDYDNRFDDDANDGHIGDIAIYNPCTPGITAELAPARASIAIDKTCEAGAAGAKVWCRITVANIGTGLSATPIQFTETTTVLAGPDADSLLRISEARPDRAGWTCTPAPSTAFSCTLPAAELVPGTSRSVEVLVATADMIADSNRGFRNCAKLSEANGGREFCAEGGTPQITVEKTAPPFCPPGQPCTFEITVSNSADSAFAGPVTIIDAISGGPATIPVASINPPLPCTSQPTLSPFSCTGTLTLDPGEAQTFQITLTMPAGAPFQARNCIAVTDPALQLQPGDLGPPDDEEPSHVACVTVPVAPDPLPNLTIAKTAPAQCIAGSTCTFNITLANNGDGPFAGSVVLSDNMQVTGAAGPLPITSIVPPLPGAAQPGQVPFNCTAPLALPAGTQQTFAVSVQMPPNMSFTALNCAAITPPGAQLDPTQTVPIGQA